MRSHRGLQRLALAHQASTPLPPSAAWVLEGLLLGRCISSHTSSSNQQAPPSHHLGAQAQGNSLLHALLSPSTAAAHHPHLWHELQSLRYAHAHLAPRARLTQGADTVYIDEILRSSGGQLETLALPILRHCHDFNPQQTVRTLERLPCLVDWQVQRFGGLAPRALSSEQHQMLDVLIHKLAARLAEVAADCTPQELARGLWGIGAACRRHNLPPHSSTNDAFSAAATHLLHTMSSSTDQQQHQQQQQQQPSKAALNHTSNSTEQQTQTQSALSHTATIVWACAAARRGENSEVRAFVEAVAQHVGQLTPEAALESLDHRAVAKLSCAFHALGVRDAQAARVLSDTTTGLLSQQLQEHDPSTGPLQPRYFYRYRTVRSGNGFEITTTPKPPRPSKYLHDNSPSLVSRDFELATLAPTLRALGALGSVTPNLLDAATRQLLASRQDSSSSISISSSSISSATTESSSSSSSSPMRRRLSAGNGGRVARPPAALGVVRALLGAGMPLSPKLAGQLLLSVAAGDRGHAPRTARTLRLAVGCGLPASHPVVRLLLQQLQDSMALPSATDSSSQPEKSLKSGERQLGGNDASRVVEGAEGGFSWVQKRAGYEVKRQHLRQVRGQREEGPSRQRQQVTQLSTRQAALTACAVMRCSGASEEGTVSQLIDTLVTQAANAKIASSSAARSPLSYLMPFSKSRQESSSAKAEMEQAKDAHAMARLLLALARESRAAQRQQSEDSQSLEAHKQKLVFTLSAEPHTLTRNDALRVALAHATWKSPTTPSDPSQRIQQKQQQSDAVIQWVQRAIEARGGDRSAVLNAAVNAASTPPSVQAAEPAAGVLGGVSPSSSSDEAARSAEKAREEEERRARMKLMAEEEAGMRAEIDAFVSGLPVGVVRALASASSGSIATSKAGVAIMAALRERAGFV